MSSEKRNTLIIAGGGTGGHVLAGVAVADAWSKGSGESVDILFVGAKGGIEEKLVPRAGYALSLLKLGSLNGVGWLKKIKTLFRIPFALLKSFWILLTVQPVAVLGVGGYASGPLVLMAKVMSFFHLLKARTAILEQNSVPGMTNRILGRLVQKVFCAFPGMESRFANKKVVLTGNPIRSAIQPLPSATRDPFTVFIFGGSQGAQGINTLVIEALPLFEDIKSHLRFIHQTGEKDFDRVAEAHRNWGTNARVEKFIYDMPTAYSEASLVICRAGSSTLSEIAAVGRAALLIPFPFASDNHQEVNARVFSDAGAALLLVQQKANGLDLARLIRGAFQDQNALTRMEKAVAHFYRPDAARAIAQELLLDSPKQLS